MDKLKALLSTTKGKIIMGGLILVLLLVFLRKRNGGSSSFGGSGSSGSLYGGGSGSGGGVTTTDLANITSTFQQQLNQQNEQYKESVQGMQTEYAGLMQSLNTEMEARTNLLASNMQAMKQGYESQLSAQYTNFTNIIGGLTNTINSMDSRFNAQMQAYQSGINNQLAQYAAGSIFNNAVSPVVVNTYDDTIYGYSNPYPLVGQAARETEQPRFGYGGADYNQSSTEQKKQMQEHESRIKSDSAYRQSEIERAKAVIRERESAGLDTSAQKKYLEKNLGYTG